MPKVEVITARLNQVKSQIQRIIKKVCAYARVSTDSEEQLTSYNSQIEYYSNKIKSNPDWEYVGVYADEGITGTQVKNRTEFQRMIDDALNGKIDIIIAKSISRFARNTLDTLKYCRELREHGVDVYFEKENIHTLELDSEMFLTLYSAFAQAESESTSMNVKMGLKAKMKRGEAVGFYGCYGLKWDKKEKVYTIDEEEANVVRRIFKLYIEGVGTGRIAKILTNEGIKTATGKSYWQQATICRIINNEKYVGDLMTQKSYVDNPLTHKKKQNYGEKDKYYTKDHHIAIIDRETFEKAKEIYSKRSKKTNPDGHTHCDKYSLRYAFSAKIFCAFCGCNYVRRSCKRKTTEGKHVYWACTHRVSSGAVCCSRSIRDEYLKELFVEVHNKLCKEYKKSNDKLMKIIKDSLEKNDYANELKKIESEINSVNSKISNLLDLKLENYIDKDAYMKKEIELTEKLKDLKEKRINVEKKMNSNQEISNRLKKIEKVLSGNNKITEFDREVFDSLVECIIVGEKNDDGTENPYVIKFILKTGKEIRKDFDNKIRRNNTKEKSEEISSLSNDNEELSLDKDKRL